MNALHQNLTYIKNNIDMLIEISDEKRHGEISEHDELCKHNWQYDGKCKCSDKHKVKVYEQCFSDIFIILNSVKTFNNLALKEIV